MNFPCHYGCSFIGSYPQRRASSRSRGRVHSSWPARTELRNAKVFAAQASSPAVVLDLDGYFTLLAAGRIGRAACCSFRTRHLDRRAETIAMGNFVVRRDDQSLGWVAAVHDILQQN